MMLTDVNRCWQSPGDLNYQHIAKFYTSYSVDNQIKGIFCKEGLVRTLRPENKLEDAENPNKFSTSEGDLWFGAL